MTNQQFTAWREHMALTKVAAAALLGLSSRTIALYEAHQPIPKTVELACGALAMGLRAYPAEREGLHHVGLDRLATGARA